MNISIEQYLKRLANDLKYENLYSLVAPKYFKLQLPDLEPIEIFETDQSIQFISPVGKLIEGLDEEKLYSYLMNANFLGQGTGKSVLGLHPDDKTIVLSQCLFFDIDYTDFKDRIEEMVNYIDYLKEHLQTKIPSFLKES